MRYICYEIYMLRIFHVSLVEVNLRPFSAVCKIVDVKVFENTNPSKVLNWSQQNVFKTRVTIGEYSLLLFLVICHSLKSEPFVNTGSFGTANFKVLPPPSPHAHTNNKYRHRFELISVKLYAEIHKNGGIQAVTVCGNLRLIKIVKLFVT